MATKLKWEWNDEAFREMLNDPGVMAFVKRTAEEHIPHDGYDYKVTTSHTKTRCKAKIECDNIKTGMHNRKTNALIKAIGGGG